MGLKEVLQKMKLVEVEEASAAAAASAATPASATRPPAGIAGAAPRQAAPPPDLAAILRSIPGVGPIEDEPKPAPAAAKPVASPAAAPVTAAPEAAAASGENLPDFVSVYQSAKISDPPHGYSALKVLEILTSEGFADLDRKAKAAALLGFLRMNPAGPVPIHEVIQDAVRRDQALDRFEDFLQQRLTKRAQELEKDNAALQAEVDALTIKNRDKMTANRRTLEAETEKLTEWQLRKRVEEKRLFEAIAPFVEENPVSAPGSDRPIP